MNASTSTLEQQLTALSDGAGLCTFPTASHLVLRGADRASLLHNLCSNDIKGLAPGHGTEAFVCNPQGKILAHILVYVCEDHLRVIALGQTGAVEVDATPLDLAAYIDRYVFREDVQIEDIGQGGLLSLSGANAAAVLSAVTDTPELTEYGIAPLKLEGKAAWIAATPILAPASFLLMVDPGDIDAVSEPLLAAGAVACDEEAFEITRIASGFPVHGADITDRSLPQEICRDKKAISFTTGCYTGQETVARIDALGHVNWHLTTLVIENDQPPLAGAPLSLEGKDVGRITSAAFHPVAGKTLILATVRRLQNKPGVVLSSPAGDATITEPPLV